MDLFILFTDQQLADQIPIKRILDEQVQPKFNKLTIRESIRVKENLFQESMAPVVLVLFKSHSWFGSMVFVVALIRESAVRSKPELFQDEK